MQVIIHQTHLSLADFEGIESYFEKEFNKKTKGLHIFPELFLTGYPLQDLCLQKSFIQKYHQLLERLKQKFETLIDHDNCCLLFGGLKYTLSEKSLPIHIQNVVYQVGLGKMVDDVYAKQLLPNYDVFDEKKYFKKGENNYIGNFWGKEVGILICEDMWASSFHEWDPVQDLAKFAKIRKVKLDMVVNLSGSPFHLNKHKKRINRAMEISHMLKCPYVYSNKVGAEDEIIFDGGSFVVDGSNVLVQGKRFQSDILSWKYEKSNQYNDKVVENLGQTWEGLFNSRLDLAYKPPILEELTDDQCHQILSALCLGIQDYAQKNDIKKFTLALSGGIDSSLVLTILTLSLKAGQDIEVLYMPGVNSPKTHYEFALELCQNLKVPMINMPIKFLHSTAKNLYGQYFPEEVSDYTDTALHARLRSLMMYTRTNQSHAIVINTSNKSEIAIGYSTIYGDSVGALSVLGDLYKTEIYALAKYINKKFKKLIPQGIIDIPPISVLKSSRIDTTTIPHYKILDAILEGILNYRYSREDLIKKGFNESDVEKVLHLYQNSEYKRVQLCPILKVSVKSFGFGYRIPISKSSQLYTGEWK